MMGKKSINEMRIRIPVRQMKILGKRLSTPGESQSQSIMGGISEIILRVVFTAHKLDANENAAVRYPMLTSISK